MDQSNPIIKDVLNRIISKETEKGKAIASSQEKQLKSLVNNSPVSETILGVSESRDLAVYVVTELLKRFWSAEAFLNCFNLFLYDTPDNSTELSDFIHHYVLEKLDASALQGVIQ